MSTLTIFLATAGIPLVRFLFHVLWQGTLLAVLAFLVLRWVLSRDPRMGEHYALATLALMVLVPVLTTVRGPTYAWPVHKRIHTFAALGNTAELAGRASAPVPPQRAAALDSDRSDFYPASSVPEVPLTSVTLRPERSHLRVLRLHPRWALVSVAWFLGVLFCAGRLFRQLMLVVRLKRHAQPIGGEPQRRLQEWRRRLRLKRRVAVCQVPNISSPLSIGYRRAMVLVPAHLVREIRASEWDDILVHELLHLKRRDDYRRLVQNLLYAVLWFHPGAVWLVRQLDLNRELAVDRAAVAQTGAPARYARCLLRMFQAGPRRLVLDVAPGAPFTHNKISRRIEMLARIRKQKPSPWVHMAFIVTLVGLVLFAGSLLRAAPGVAVSQTTGTLTATSENPVALHGVVTPRSDKAAHKPKPQAASSPSPGTEIQKDLQAIRGALAKKDQKDRSEKERKAELEKRVQKVQQEMLRLQQKLQEQQARNLQTLEEETLGRYEKEMQRLQEQLRVQQEMLEKYASELAEQTAVEVFVPEEFNITRRPRIPESELIPLLTDIVRRDRDPRVREEALRAICRLRSVMAFDTLLDLYQAQKDPKIRRSILRHIGHFTPRDPTLRDRLGRLAETVDDPDLQLAILGALSRGRDPAVTPYLLRAYDRVTDSQRRKDLIRYLSRVGTPEALQKLKDIARHDPDPDLRREAIRRLIEPSSPPMVLTPKPPRPPKPPVAPKPPQPPRPEKPPK